MRLPIALCASLLAVGCNSTVALIALGGAAIATGGMAGASGPVYHRRPPNLETWTILARDAAGGPLLVQRRIGEQWTLRPGLCGWTTIYTYVGARWEYPRATLIGPRGEVCQCWVGERIL